jgi:ABC-type glycerol-3-phosphate transport system substrate-binding protein
MMNKSIIVGLVALGLTACGGAVEDQPTDAVTAEAPAVEVVDEEVAAAEVESAVE